MNNIFKMAPKKVTESVEKVVAPVASAPEKKSRSKKTEDKPATVVAPATEKKSRSKKTEDKPATEPVSTSEEDVEKKRRKVDKDTVNTDFETVLTRIAEEVAKIKASGDKARGIKAWKTVNKLVKQLQHDTNKVTKFKTSTRKANNTSGFLKPVKISDEMAVFTNWDKNKTYSRTDVTRFICNYIKEKALNDQNDKRNINCDAKLKKLLKYDPADPKLPKDEKTGKTLPLTYFRLQQYLKHHFIKVETEELDQ